MSYLKDDQANGSDSNFQQGPRKHSPTPSGETELQLDMSLSEAREEFELMTKVSGKAESTIESYKYTYNRLIQEIDKETPIGEISTKDIRLFLSELMDDGLSKNTVAIHYRNLGVFFNWLVRENFLEDSPLEPVEEPKTPDKYPKVLDKEEIATLLETEKKRSNTWAGYRNYVMLLVFIDTGVRLNEFRNAKIEDLDLENRTLKVHGKGAKDRKVSFGPKTAKHLHRWLRKRDNVEKVWDDTIFISQNGDKLKTRNVQRIITRIQKRAGLENKQVSPHVLRHSSATLAVQNGLDTFSLKRQFGWEQVDTALRYVHISNKQISETYRDSSPISSIP